MGCELLHHRRSDLQSDTENLVATSALVDPRMACGWIEMQTKLHLLCLILPSHVLA